MAMYKSGLQHTTPNYYYHHYIMLQEGSVRVGRVATWWENWAACRWRHLTGVSVDKKYELPDSGIEQLYNGNLWLVYHHALVCTESKENEIWAGELDEACALTREL